MTMFTGKYSVYGLLDDQDQEDALFQLFDAGSLMWRKVLTADEARDLKGTVVAALHNFEQHFPVSEMDIKLHNWIHLAEKLTLTGPFQSTYMFPYERSYKLMREWMTNKRYPESTMLKASVRFQHSLAWMADREYQRLIAQSDTPQLRQMEESRQERLLFGMTGPNIDGGEVSVAIPSYER